MRQITRDAVNAFYNGDSFKRDNTQVFIDKDGENCFKLHNAIIAKFQFNGKLWLNTDGWLTTTTKERLNGILSKLNLAIKQKQGKWRVYDLKGDSIPFVDCMEVILWK